MGGINEKLVTEHRKKIGQMQSPYGIDANWLGPLHFGFANCYHT